MQESEVKSQDDPAKTPAKRDRVVLLDVFRVIAAVVVVIYHLAFRGNAAGNMSVVGIPVLVPVFKYGYLGVEFFFIISGFVISYTANSGSVRRFVTSRALRLYPTFWICCTITVLAMWIYNEGRYKADLFVYLVNLTMLSNWFGVGSVDGVYWSLFVELQFYAYVAICIWLGLIKYLDRLAYLWLAVSAFLLVVPSYTLSLYTLSPYAPLFVAGSLFYLCYRDGHSLARYVGIVVSLLIACCYATEKAGVLQERYDTPFSKVSVVLIICCIYCSFIPVVLHRVKTISPIWVTLGAATYPLYLIHQHVGYMLMNTLAPRLGPTLSFLGAIVTATAIAFIVSIGLEPPVRAMLRSLIRPAPAPAVTSVAGRDA